MLTHYEKLCNMFFRVMNDTVSASVKKRLLFILDLLASDTQVVIAQVFLVKISIPLRL